jgi:hypothetical protein
MAGLLGLGGFGGIGGAKPPAGLLGQYFDPAEMRKQQMKQGLLMAGIGMLTNGKGSTGEVLGQSLGAGLQGANQAGINYKQDAMGYQQMAQQQEEQKEKERNKAAVMQWLDGLPEDQQELARVNPQMAAEAYMKQQFAGPGEGFTLGAGQVRYGPNGQQIAAGPSDIPKPTDDMREYEVAKQQGYGGTFQQYMIEMKKAGASSVNVNGGDGNFDKELSKGVAGVYTSAMEAGQNAVATKSAAQQLRVLMKGRGGSLDGLSAAAAPYLPPGLVPEGASDIVAAQAIIAGLVPKQRVPGSGTTSDFDAKKFSESLPSLWNKPGANEIITNTMESYADYQIAVSNAIADVASNPQIANKAAAIREQIAKIPDPFIGWKKYMAASGSGASSPAVDDLVNRYRSK